MNLHPVFTHFPVVLAPLLLFYEIINFSQIKHRFIISVFLTFFLVFSFFSGLSEQSKFETLPALAEQTLKLHYNLGRVALFLGILISFTYFLKLYQYKDLYIRNILIILQLILVVIVFYSGWLGGKLVFEFALGVKI